jgi:hypothetical protein
VWGWWIGLIETSQCGRTAWTERRRQGVSTIVDFRSCPGPIQSYDTLLRSRYSDLEQQNTLRSFTSPIKTVTGDGRVTRAY